MGSGSYGSQILPLQCFLKMYKHKAGNNAFFTSNWPLQRTYKKGLETNKIPINAIHSLGLQRFAGTQSLALGLRADTAPVASHSLSLARTCFLVWFGGHCLTHQYCHCCHLPLLCFYVFAWLFLTANPLC